MPLRLGSVYGSGKICRDAGGMLMDDAFGLMHMETHSSVAEVNEVYLSSSPEEKGALPSLSTGTDIKHRAPSGNNS
ncbi:hypothetical protein GCM10010981_29150 [Dyella nitratireducens]|uniref:Uncharacterized protein n=1 Tax=Dyella nitratireducens TaxID=1849580 RepID=A0ABQ1G7E4_9GAMM|nr:hypothetical protein GCM10010981_29150 [Dyella nitratireducens]GLQ40272.1 hypothetical protein GCM10007902_01210 [Dyella nitratireducens]